MLQILHLLEISLQRRRRYRCRRRCRRRNRRRKNETKNLSKQIATFISEQKYVQFDENVLLILPLLFSLKGNRQFYFHHAYERLMQCSHRNMKKMNKLQFVHISTCTHDEKSMFLIIFKCFLSFSTMHLRMRSLVEIHSSNLAPCAIRFTVK